MTPVSTERTVYPLADAIKEMAVRVREALTSPTMQQSQPVIRLQVPVETTDILSWLQVQHTFPHIYWSGRDEAFETAAVGIADELLTIEHLAKYLTGEHSDNIRYYGGFRFDQTVPHDTSWGNFGDTRFILPRFELARQEHEYMFACHIIAEHDCQQLDTILNQLDQLTSTTHVDTLSIPPLIHRTDLPEKNQWEKTIQSALDMITQGAIDKIVLARESTLTFTEQLSPLALIQKLKIHTNGCYHFCFASSEQVAFLGASPEQLYVRDRNHIKSEALAGTRQRGNDDNIDARLGDELLTSDKDIREHRYVIEGITGAFRQLCREYSGGEDVELVKLSRVQHLVSYLSGELKENKTDSDILQTLHPTPAVCGSPTTAAQRQIAMLEPFDRGWYSGPVGWVSRDKAEFAVAIRSGLITGSTLKLYSGAGIVDGSHPEQEWDEIESKIRNYLRIVTEQ